MSFVASYLYRFDEFELYPGRRSLTRNGMPVAVSPKAFEVLTYLVANPGRVVTKDELLKAVWPESFVEEGNLSQHIFALRRALGDKAAASRPSPAAVINSRRMCNPLRSPRQLLKAPRTPRITSSSTSANGHRW